LIKSGQLLDAVRGHAVDRDWLTPARCVRVLAMVRFARPAAEIRMAGGREMHLRTLQPLVLHVANSLFLGDYLTSEGQAVQADLA
jgi:biotin synthase